MAEPTEDPIDVPATDADSKAPKRTRRRALVRVALFFVAGYLALVATYVMEPSLPSDLVLNLLPVSVPVDLRAEQPTLVVLQHGLWRSWGSMWRMQRALQAAGYEVLNFSYPSTRGTVEEFAERLHERLEERLRERGRPPERLCFVGHSLGGLVVRAYLARPDARHADACVFLGTPQRGAILAELRSRLWLYTAVMGSGAGLELRPASPLFTRLGDVPCPSIGVIFGARGDGEGWNDDIPGDDDGTVGASEAQLPRQQTDAIGLRRGHTTLSFSAESIHQVLAFLHDGRFDHSQPR